MIDFTNYADADYAINFTKNIQPATAIKVVKTWLNGWATSARMHEEVVLPCLFGCSGKTDDLIHYLQCPHLYALCNYFFKADSCPLIRIGFRNPTIHNLKLTACVFTAYHVLKAQIRNGHLDGMQKDTRTIHAAWSVFANALEAEAGEHRISYTVFSLPKFISFLVNGHDHDPSSLTHQVINFPGSQEPNSSVPTVPIHIQPLHHVVQMASCRGLGGQVLTPQPPGGESGRGVYLSIFMIKVVP